MHIISIVSRHIAQILLSNATGVETKLSRFDDYIDNVYKLIQRTVLSFVNPIELMCCYKEK